MCAARGPWERLQLPCGLIFMLAVVFLFNAAWNPSVVYTTHFRTTITFGIITHTAGYIAYRRFDVFPGMAAVGAILPIFLLCYSAALGAILLLRLDYSRVQLMECFLASVTWYFGSAFVGRRLYPYRLAIVPGGQADQMVEIPGVRWSFLSSPTSSSFHAHGVVADLRVDLSKDWERFVADCALSGMPVYHVKQVQESLTGRVKIDHLSENTLGSLNPNHLYIVVKQLLDWLLALVSIIALLPLFLIIAIAIQLDSPGPVLFKQDRVGYRGRRFRVYKFRTMHESREGEYRDEKQRAITVDADSRVTRLGSYLRRTRIDELPQVLNILRGEMSWIGPRPEALPLSQWYEAELPFYRYRHIVRPGITGWAQVNQGHVTGLDDVLEKLHYDFYYIKNFSPWLDLSIAARTLVIVVTGFGAR